MDEVDEARRYQDWQRQQARSFEYIVYAVFAVIIAWAVVSLRLLEALDKII